jgi:tetratricopeptide (TPR) repeat protein
MQLTMGPGAPPFFMMGGDNFQTFCREIFAKLDNVSQCQQYGKKGAKDFGVDILAHKDDGTKIVGQCKAYRNLEPILIKKVTDDFFKHWDKKWKDEQVKEFVLVVGSDLIGTSQFDALEIAKKEFASYGIKYSWWDATKLTNLLKSHAEIVARFCWPHEDYWVEFICGVQLNFQAAANESSVIVQNALISQNQLMSQIIHDDSGPILELADRYLKEGNALEARNLVQEHLDITTNKQGIAIERKAEINCFLGNLALWDGEIPEARKYLTDAFELGKFACCALLQCQIAIHENDNDLFEIGIEDCTPEQQVCLRCSFHLNNGRADEALRLLDNFERLHSTISPAVLKVKAIALLLSKQASSALAAIDSSLALEPKWKQSRYLSGVIRFYSSISSCQIPPVIRDAPYPVYWTFIQRSLEGKQRSQEAIGIFKQLIAVTTNDDRQKKVYEHWLLACLSTNFAYNSEASKLCEDLLKCDPLDEVAIRWGIATKLDVDFVSSIGALQLQLDAGSDDEYGVLTLTSILCATQKFDRAKKLLHSYSHLFRSETSKVNLAFWSTQIALFLNEDDVELELCEEALLMLLPNIKSHLALRQVLAKINITRIEGMNFFHICLAHAKLEEWGFIADRTDDLLRQVETEDSVRLACQALYETRCYRGVIDILDKNLTRFTNEILPSDIHFMKAESLKKLGSINESLSEAQRAVALHENTQTLLRYSQLLASSCQNRMLIVVVQKLSKRSDLTEVQAIRLAEMVCRIEQPLARRLWLKAASAFLPVKNLVLALNLGYFLGLENTPQYNQVQNRVSEAAKQGNDEIRYASLSEVVAQIRKQAKLVRVHTEAYFNGSASVHSLCDLPLLYETSFESAKRVSNLSRITPVFAVHEDRRMMDDLVLSDTTLYADVTAIMLADRFNYLDFIILNSKAVFVANETVQVINAYKDSIPLEMEQVTKARGEFLQLIDSNEISTTVVSSPAKLDDDANEQVRQNLQELLKSAMFENAFLLQNLPNFVERTWLTEKQVAVLCDLQALLKSNQSINSTEKNPVLESIPDSLAPNIPKGSRILIGSNSIKEIQLLGVLPEILKNFHLIVPLSEVVAERQEQINSQLNGNTYKWLIELTETIGEKVLDGSLQTLPEVPSLVRNPSTFFLDPLSSLIAAKPDDNLTAIWIDDRFVNGYQWQESGAPIVSTFDLLKHLSLKEELANTSFGKLCELRKGNVRYLPLLANELVFQLRRAEGINSAFEETEALKAIRLYVASTLAQGSYLHRQNNFEYPIVFLNALYMSLIQAWDDVWTSMESFERKLSKALWLKRCLFADPLSLSLIGGFEDQTRTLATIHSDLLYTALLIKTQVGQEHSQQYLKWYQGAYLNLLTLDKVSLVTDIAMAIRDIITAKIEEDEANQITVNWLYWWCENLPEVIKSEVMQDEIILQKLGIAFESVLTILETTVELSELERSIATALETAKPQSIFDRERDCEATVFAEQLHNGKIGITITRSNFSACSDSSLIQILFNDPAMRLEPIRSKLREFGLESDDISRLVSAIAYKEPAHARLEKLEKAPIENYGFFLRALKFNITEKNSFAFGASFPLSVQSLLRYYSRRLDFVSPLEHFQMLLETDLTKAALYLSSLPINLPRGVVQKINALPPAELDKFIRSLSRDFSPFVRFQLARILLEHRYEKRYERFRRFVLRRISEADTTSAISALVSVFDWYSNRFARWVEIRLLPWQVRLELTWIHSSRVYNILRSSGFENERIQTLFEDAYLFTGSVVLDSSLQISNDISSTHNLSTERIYVAGLSYCTDAQERVALSEIIIESCFFKSDDFYLPLPGLLSLPGRSNCLQTFLDQDFSALAAEIGCSSDAIDTTIQDTVRWCIENLEDAKESWWLIAQTLSPKGETFPEIAQKLKLLVEQKGLFDLAKNSEAPVATIIAVSLNCGTDLEMQVSVGAGLKAIAENYEILLAASTCSEIRKNVLFNTIIQAALNVYPAHNDDLSGFCSLLETFIGTSDAFTEHLDRIIDRLWSELPTDISVQLWELRKLTKAVCTS